MTSQRTFFVMLEIDDTPPERIAQNLETDLTNLGYDVVQVDIRDDVGDTTFSTGAPITPF